MLPLSAICHWAITHHVLKLKNFNAAARLYEEMGTQNSTEAEAVSQALAWIQNEIGAEQFERLKGEAETMSLEQVIELTLA